MQQIVENLKDREILLLVLRASRTNEDVSISIIPSAEEDNETLERFVAISHIWSDELGNPFENFLSKCQVKRLQSLVNGFFPDSSEAIPF